MNRTDHCQDELNSLTNRAMEDIAKMPQHAEKIVQRVARHYHGFISQKSGDYQDQVKLDSLSAQAMTDIKDKPEEIMQRVACEYHNHMDPEKTESTS